MVLRNLAFVLLLTYPTPAQETVRITAEDGQPLEGTYHAPEGTPRGGVLLLHMYRSNRHAWRPLTGRLAAAGFHVLALDMRGHGGSANGPAGERIDVGRGVTSDPKSNPFLKMHLDARAGLEELVKRGANRASLGVVGASVGCSVALHAASLHKDMVAALVLMTPGKDYLGVPSLDHAGDFGDRPCLILSSEEEAPAGASPLKAVLDGGKVVMRLVPERGVHGTRMFGKVEAIEADIIEWLRKALLGRMELAIAVAKDVIIDGDVEKEEAAAATRFQFPIGPEKNAGIRVSRNRRQLVVGFVVPERYLRRNEVIVYVEGNGSGEALSQSTSWKVSFNPKNPVRRPVMVWNGAGGAWKEAPAEGVLAFAQTSDKKQWSAEVALALSRFVAAEAPCTIRLAFQVNGQKEDSERFYPATGNVKTSPRTWITAKLAGL